MERRTITVDGMSCGHCKAAIEQALLALPGVLMAQADVGTKEVVVEFDPEQITLTAIKERIDETGFTPH